MHVYFQVPNESNCYLGVIKGFVTRLFATTCTIEITTTIEIIISIVVENAFQTKHLIAITNEITTTIEIIISIDVENAFKTKQSVPHY